MASCERYLYQLIAQHIEPTAAQKDGAVRVAVFLQHRLILILRE